MAYATAVMTIKGAGLELLFVRIFSPLPFVSLHAKELIEPFRLWWLWAFHHRQHLGKM